MGGGRRDLAWLGGLVAVLLVVLVWPYAVDGHPFGVGPDVPVYLWWTRVGANEGLSMIGIRPGAPALAAALGETLLLDAAAVTAGLASALGVALGASAAAFVRAGGGRRAEVWLAGLLAGVFSVHLVAGYLANVILAVCVLAEAACLAGERRTRWAAALLLAGGGLAHPAFLVHAIVVLLGTAALAWRAGARDEARDVVLAAGAGGLVAGAGVLATIAGPGPIAAETSRDGLLRRAGLDAVVTDAYRERFRLRAARYVQWISVPLAVLGVGEDGRLLRRFLLSWLVVMAFAIPLGWVTGWFPPDRIVTFGFAVPIAAALGVGWVLRRQTRRAWVARIAVAALVAWMIVGGLLAWFRQSTFVSAHEAQVARTAMFRVGTPPGSPARRIVVVVDDPDATATFLAARAANILRAAAYPQRADDMFVFVGRATDFFAGHPTIRGDPEYDALSRITFEDVPTSAGRVVLVLAPFYRGDDLDDTPDLIHLERDIWSSENLPEIAVAAGTGPLGFGPSSGLAISLATLMILTLLTVLGLGYAASVFSDRVTMLATAPAFGAAAVTIAAVLLDRLGLRLAQLPVGPAASALAGLGGLVLFLVQRQRNRQSSA